MKQYSSAEALVLSLAKDCKNALQTSAQFEFSYNGMNIVITSMNNQNSSKVTIYSGSVNGVDFKGSITALKKRLNVTYTKEYNRSSEVAKTAKTVITVKTDKELSETAKVANERIMQALATLRKYSDRYGLGMVATFVGIDSVETLVLQALQREREIAISLQKAKEAKEREERERETKRLMQLQTQRNAIMAKLAEASAKQDFASVMQLSAELAKLK